MASTKYTYTISTGTANGAVSAAALHSEIDATAIVTAIDYINTSGDTLDVWMKAALSAGDEDLLDAAVAAHTGVPIEAAAQQVEVVEERGPVKTEGKFQFKMFKFDIDSGTPGDWILDLPTISWPHPVACLSASWCQDSSIEGDEGVFLSAENVTVGAITSDVAVDDTVINVSSTALANISIGYGVRLVTGGTTSELGVCIAKDVAAGTITVETAAANAHAAATPTYVKIDAFFCPSLQFGGAYRIDIGGNRIGGSYLPANTPMRLRWRNNDGQAKTFRMLIEYLY